MVYMIIRYKLKFASKGMITGIKKLIFSAQNHQLKEDD